MLLSLATAFGTWFNMQFLPQQKDAMAVRRLIAMLLLTVVTASAAFWLPYHLAIRLTIANAMLTIVGIVCRQRAVGARFQNTATAGAVLVVSADRRLLIPGLMNKFGIVPRNLFHRNMRHRRARHWKWYCNRMAMADHFNREPNSARHRNRKPCRRSRRCWQHNERRTKSWKTGCAGTEALETADRKLEEMSNAELKAGPRRAQPPLFRSGLSAGIEPHAAATAATCRCVAARYRPFSRDASIDTWAAQSVTNA